MSTEVVPYPDPIIPLSETFPLHENACRDCPFPFNVSLKPGQATRVQTIIGIKTSYTMKLPSDLILSVEGEVPTGGWSKPDISRAFYLLPPEDGILDLYFTAVPPDGIVIQITLPINAGTIIPNAGSADFWGKDKPLKGLRIHGTDAGRIFNFPPGRDKPIDIDISKA